MIKLTSLQVYDITPELAKYQSDQRNAIIQKSKELHDLEVGIL